MFDIKGYRTYRINSIAIQITLSNPLLNRSFSAKDHRSYEVRRSLGTADT